MAAAAIDLAAAAMPAPRLTSRFAVPCPGPLLFEIPAFGYRVLREDEKPWHMREPETEALAVMPWSDLRDAIARHIAYGNDPGSNPYNILSFGTHEACCLLGREREYIYGDKPVYVRIDMSKIPGEYIIPMNTEKAAMFHLCEEDPIISHR